MQVEPNKIAVFHYRASDVTDGGDAALDSSHDRGEPLAVLIGAGNIVPGLEKAMMGHAAGDEFDVTVEPADGYGERREDWLQRVPKKYFNPALKLVPGMVATLSMQKGGQRQVTVMKVGSSVVDVDLNPPLAGRTLRFSVELLKVRDAQPEEISHRHAHGPEGGAHANE